MGKDSRMREGAGVGVHESKPQREIWGAEIWSLAYSECFRPWEKAQPARQNVWSEKRSKIELPGPPKGQVMKALQRRRKLARNRKRSTVMGRKNFRRKDDHSAKCSQEINYEED